MTFLEKKMKAETLYMLGLPIWQIASEINESEWTVCRMLGKK